MSLKTINIEVQAYFVTSKVYQNTNIFVNDKFCRVIIDTFKFMKKQKKFKLISYVIMPDHLHTIMWPMGMNNISDIMRDFKQFTSRRIINYIKSEKRGSPDLRGPIRLDQEIQPSRTKNGYNKEIQPFRNIKKIKCPIFSEMLNTFKVNSKKQTYQLWQSRNWVENIFSEKFLCQKIDYIHNNPVRAGLVKNPEDYEYSSYRNYYLDDNSLIEIDNI